MNHVLFGSNFTVDTPIDSQRVRLAATQDSFAALDRFPIVGPVHLRPKDVVDAQPRESHSVMLRSEVVEPSFQTRVRLGVPG